MEFFLPTGVPGALRKPTADVPGDDEDGACPPRPGPCPSGQQAITIEHKAAETSHWLAAVRDAGSGQWARLWQRDI